MKFKRCKYQDQDTKMTLRNGVKEYFEANPHLILPSSLEEKSSKFFDYHDRVHVVFGCDTSILNEFMADFWTLFGSDMTVLRYARCFVVN